MRPEYDPEKITEDDLWMLVDELIARPDLAEACDVVGLNLFAVRLRMKNDDEFAKMVESAKDAGSDRIVSYAMKRALGDHKTLKTFGGKPMMVVNPETGADEYVYEIDQSDRLLLSVLKAVKPEMFGDKAEITHNAGTGVLKVPSIESAEEFEAMLGQIAEEAQAEMDEFDAESNGGSNVHRLDAPAG